MAFRNDYSKANQGNSLKPEGLYEVLIQRAEEKVTPNGKHKIAFSMVIRNDVNQQYKNGLIFYDIWAKKEPNADDLQVGGYNFGQLMALAEAAKLPQDKEYDSLLALLNDIIGQPVCASLIHDDYNDKVYEKVDRIMPTAAPNVAHKPKEKPGSSGYAVPAAAQFATAASTAPAAPVEGDDDYPF